jgi:hypothetical protein
VQATWSDKNKSEAVLKIIPKFGDVVHYEFDQVPTQASDKVTDFNNWKTDEMVVWFLCVDSKGSQETGKPYKWVNHLNLRFNIYDAGDEKKVKLEASALDARILYTTDGSDPKENGATYAGDFIVPKDSKYVLAIANKKGVFSERLEININWNRPEGFRIINNKPLTFQKGGMFTTNNNKSTFEELTLFNKHRCTFGEVFLNFEFKINGRNHWANMHFDSELKLNKEQLEAHIDFMRNSIPDNTEFETSLQLGSIHFEAGQNFNDWMEDKQMQFTNFKQQEIIQ